ncbi:MAG: YjzD family protein [Bacillus sp. (in: firmicutes)]
MRYLATLFWVALLLQMAVYVASSMMGVDYNLNTGLVLAIPVTILISILPAVLPNEPVEHGHH